MLSSFLCLELATSSELAEIIDRGVEQGSQLIHRQEVGRAFHTSLQIEVEGLFHGESDEVYQGGILANIRLLKGLDIAWTPFSEHQRWWIAILHEYQVEQKSPDPPIAVSKRMQHLEVMMGDRSTCHRVVVQGIVTRQPVNPLCEVQGNIFGWWRCERSPTDIDRDRAQFAGMGIDLVHHQAMQHLHGFNSDGT